MQFGDHEAREIPRGVATVNKKFSMGFYLTWVFLKRAGPNPCFALLRSV